MIVLILAGGEGSRVWPLSRNEFPKQFLSFGDQYSLLQKTILRFNSYQFVSKILISTNDLYKKFVDNQIASIDCSKECEVILEPFRKNTAPAIAYSIRYLQDICKVGNDEMVLVIPSDHFIESESAFHEYLKSVQDSARSKIVIFGVPAKKPETGYGYIEISDKYDEFTYKINKFKEKPTLEEAKSYIDSGNHFWNCGMFLFSINVFWEQIKLFSPDIFDVSKSCFSDVRDFYSRFPDISIDYALIEKTKAIVFCPMSVNWYDIGSWDSVYELLKKDIQGNALVGLSEGLGNKNSLIINESGKRVLTIGVEDMIVVNTSEALLVVKRGDSQKIKVLLKKLSV